MKLGDLRGAIRKTKGNPFVRVTLGPGIPPMNLVLQKGALFESLDTAFPDGRGQETGLSYDPENGMLFVEGAAPAPMEDDEDDDGLLV